MAEGAAPHAMTAKLDITRAQMKAIAAAARESGCVCEVEIGGVVYRAIPDGQLDYRREEAEPRRWEIDL